MRLLPYPSRLTPLRVAAMVETRQWSRHQSSPRHHSRPSSLVQQARCPVPLVIISHSRLHRRESEVVRSIPCLVYAQFLPLACLAKGPFRLILRIWAVTPSPSIKTSSNSRLDSPAACHRDIPVPLHDPQSQMLPLVRPHLLSIFPSSFLMHF